MNRTTAIVFAAAVLTASALPMGMSTASTATSNSDPTASCKAWVDYYWAPGKSAKAYIYNHASGARGGGIQVETRECASGGTDYREFRTAMLIYGPLSSGTRAVAGVYNSGDEDFCVVLPGEPDRYCHTDPIRGTVQLGKGIVQVFRNNVASPPYASGYWPGHA